MGMNTKLGRKHLVFLFGAHILPGVFDKDLLFHEPHVGASLFEDDEVLSVRFWRRPDLTIPILVNMRVFSNQIM